VNWGVRIGVKALNVKETIIAMLQEITRFMANRANDGMAILLFAIRNSKLKIRI